MKKVCQDFCVSMMFFICLAGCGQNTASQEKENEITKNDSFGDGIDSAGKATGPNTVLMDSVGINKENFSMSDTIILNFQASPPRQFGIVTPDDEFYFIASDTLIPSLPPVITSDQFVQLKKYELRVSTLMAFPYRADATRREKVFQKPGLYTLLFGNNLESDEDDKVVRKIQLL